VKHLAASIGLLGSFTVGCAKGGAATEDAPHGGVDAPRAIDARGTADASVDAPILVPDAPPAAAALLLSEVVLQPAGAEYIELTNPGATTIDLSRYYLADHGNYFRVPSGNATVDSADFIVKFPAGATIAPHGVVTVSIDAAVAFSIIYGSSPTYAITGGSMVSVVANGTPSLTNGGELIALFYWDGNSDLVRDVDLMLAGNPSTANGIVDKSGVSIDGPDGGSVPSMYATDARTLAGQGSSPGVSVSTKRVGLETGEVQNGTGNGLTGDDETTENTAMSWDTSYSAPTPGVVPAALQQ